MPYPSNASCGPFTLTRSRAPNKQLTTMGLGVGRSDAEHRVASQNARDSQPTAPLEARVNYQDHALDERIRSISPRDGRQTTAGASARDEKDGRGVGREEEGAHGEH